MGVFEALVELPIDAAAEDGDPADGPIFIVGMPRTGTTLVERILSSHPAVDSAGELPTFSNLVKRQLGTASPWVLDRETLSQMHRLDFRRLGTDYLASTQHLAGAGAYLIDKMPFNFMYIPVIARALPNAKIICLRRNPMDTCLSNYRQLYGVNFSYYNYALDLRNTARFYTHFHRLMAHFESALPGRFHSLQYETLVQEPEPQTRQLLDYCGLEWRPECLEFQHNAAPVATASALQVRRGMNRQGLERWRRYEPWLGELKGELDRAGISWSS